VIVIPGRNGGCGHVGAVELDVPVLHQGDGGVVGQVSAAGSRCGAEAVRVLAEDDAEGARGAASHAAIGHGRRLELPRALLHPASASNYSAAQQR